MEEKIGRRMQEEEMFCSKEQRYPYTVEESTDGLPPRTELFLRSRKKGP